MAPERDRETRPDGDLIDALPFAVASVAGDGTVGAVNRAWRRAIEADDPDPLLAPSGMSLVARLRDWKGTAAAVADHAADGIARLLAGRGISFQLQYHLDAPDGLDTRWFLLAVERLDDGIVVTRMETTVHHGVDDVLSELAFHDELTGLPTRGLLVDRLRMSVVRAHRIGVQPLLVFADLDGFKAINDRYGHTAGDTVLVEVGRRLTATIREGDTCGRWGGDEFVLVIELGDRRAVPSVIARLRDAVTAPIALASGEVVGVGVSIGAVVADGSTRVEALIAHADRLMYQAKASGSGWVIDPTDAPSVPSAPGARPSS